MKSRTSASCDEEKDESMDTVGKRMTNTQTLRHYQREREREKLCVSEK